MARRTVSRLASTMPHSGEPGAMRPSLQSSRPYRYLLAPPAMVPHYAPAMLFFSTLLRSGRNDRSRRVSPVAVRPGEGVRERPAGGGLSGSNQEKQEKKSIAGA